MIRSRPREGCLDPCASDARPFACFVPRTVVHAVRLSILNTAAWHTEIRPPFLQNLSFCFTTCFVGQPASAAIRHATPRLLDRLHDAYIVFDIGRILRATFAHRHSGRRCRLRMQAAGGGESCLSFRLLIATVAQVGRHYAALAKQQRAVSKTLMKWCAKDDNAAVRDIGRHAGSILSMSGDRQAILATETCRAAEAYA